MKTAKLIIGLLITIASTSYAQTLADAIKLTTNEQFEAGDKAFKSLIQAQPNNGEYYFYYGENYFNNDNAEMANTMYQKGLEVNPTNPFSYIGLGKIQWYQGENANAKSTFFKAITLAVNKNATVLLKIADIYINADTKDFVEGNKLLDLAQKLDPKNPDIYILRGDAYLNQNNDGSNAITNYEHAQKLDPKSVKAILRIGRLWNRAKNYNAALDFYKKANLIDSSFAPAYREKAEIYHRAGQDGIASIQYRKYLQLNNDCGARARFAGFLLQAKEYKESVEAAKEAQQCGLTNVYLNRYLAYGQYESSDYINGLKNSDAFFSKATPDIKIIPQDYEYRAKLLAKNGKDSLAILGYKKALELQPDKMELNNDIANSYMKMKKYSEAIGAYKNKIANGKPNANDFYGIGRAYYFSKDFINADSSFASVIKEQPDLALGYLWLAKANLQQELVLKTDNWNAKKNYETFITKIKPEEVEKNKKDLIDAYTYLAAYYAKQKDCPHTISNFKKVLELDATNAQAKKFMAKPCK